MSEKKTKKQRHKQQYVDNCSLFLKHLHDKQDSWMVGMNQSEYTGFVISKMIEFIYEAYLNDSKKTK